MSIHMYEFMTIRSHLSKTITVYINIKIYYFLMNMYTLMFTVSIIFIIYMEILIQTLGNEL